MFEYLKNLDASLKISFEDEGLTVDQASFITSLAHKNNYDVTVKVGGAEAISDMRIANNLGCDGCVAPMVESSYALHKFINSIYINRFDFANLYINIESKQAYENIEDILNHSDCKHLTGVVLGRSDFVNSYGLTKKETDSKEVFKMVKKVFTLAKEKNLKTLMGGNVNTNSYEFVSKLYKENLLDYIETRNVKVKLTNNFLTNYDANLTKMLRFEIEWLKSKSDKLSFLANADIKRVSNLELRK
jgi:4-hydroxy-2-oxoheptanedioate aldolase